MTSFRSEFFEGQYNLIMSRWFGLALICLISGSFAVSPQQKPKEPAEQEQAPPEEDEAQKPKEYSFNPLQAEKEMRVFARRLEAKRG